MRSKVDHSDTFAKASPKHKAQAIVVSNFHRHVACDASVFISVMQPDATSNSKGNPDPHAGMLSDILSFLSGIYLTFYLAFHLALS